MQCPECKKLSADSVMTCTHCGTHLGFPNVRAAADSTEVATLMGRYNQVVGKARTREAQTPLADFEAAIQRDSQAVICRPLGTLNALITSGNGLFQTFYRQVGLGRIPQGNKYDLFRTSVDNLLFPYYHEQIHFAALSLNATGVSSYGGDRPCHLVLNEMIQNRASVFEENLFLYCERTRQPATAPIPAGFRATWENRHILAIAKLGDNINKTSTAQDFPGLLLRAGRTTCDDEFIEVHIHHPLTEAAVEQARLPKIKPAKGTTKLSKLKETTEKALLKAVREKLESLNVKCQVV
jgi:hypothetical protein